jgi:ATP-dependent DNA ligase
MAENYAKAVSMDLGEWLASNPPPSFCEPKYDGFRVFLFKSGGKILLATRYARIYSENSHPALFQKLKILNSTDLSERLILDGEYIAPDQMKLFDVLRIEDRDVTELPLYERKALLAELLSRFPDFLVATVEVKSYEEILQYKQDMIEKGEEGILVKNPSSKYGEKNAWLKLKRFETIDCFVIRLEKTGDMDRSGVPHSWVLGVYDAAGRVIEVGKVGTYLKEVDPTKIQKDTVVEVKFQQITADKKLRMAHIVRIREDKSPGECLTSQSPALGSEL